MKRLSDILLIAIVAGVLVPLLWLWFAPRGPYAQQIWELRMADVDAEVAAAVAQGDHRFVGVHVQAGLVTPGTPVARDRTADVRVIPNTSDVTESAEHRELQEVARNYARRYNEALLKQLEPR